MSMITKLTFTDMIRGRACVQWLIHEIGPVTHSSGGTAIAGEGWTAVVGIKWLGAPVLWVELSEHVDEDTRMMFILRWS
jgi:hypothetical protein